MAKLDADAYQFLKRLQRFGETHRQVETPDLPAELSERQREALELKTWIVACQDYAASLKDELAAVEIDLELYGEALPEYPERNKDTVTELIAVARQTAADIENAQIVRLRKLRDFIKVIQQVDGFNDYGLRSYEAIEGGEKLWFFTRRIDEGVWDVIGVDTPDEALADLDLRLRRHDPEAFRDPHVSIIMKKLQDAVEQGHEVALHLWRDVARFMEILMLQGIGKYRLAFVDRAVLVLAEDENGNFIDVTIPTVTRPERGCAELPDKPAVQH